MANNPFMDIVSGIKTGQDYAATAMELELKREQIESRKAEAQQQRQAVEFQKADKIFSSLEKITAETRPGPKKALMNQLKANANVLGLPINPVVEASIMDEEHGKDYNEFVQNFYSLAPEEKLKMIPLAYQFLGRDGTNAEIKEANRVIAEKQLLREKYNLEAGAKGQEKVEKKTEETLKVGDDLRKEFNTLPEVKNFDTVLSSYRAIEKLANSKSTPISDRGLIFNIMRMFDPTSVVRESEQAMAEYARSMPESVQTWFEKWQSGKPLTVKQRRQFVQVAEDMLESKKAGFDDFKQRYSSEAEARGVDEGMRNRAFGRDIKKASAPLGRFNDAQLDAFKVLIDKGLDTPEKIKAATKGKTIVSADELQMIKQLDGE
jgi:hypothetical protein